MEEKNIIKFIGEGSCPVRDILSRLGDKWSILILVTLKANGTLRFSDIQRSIGDISQRMLTVTLRSLEADCLVSRKIYAVVPPKVEYEITERGLSLFPHLQALITWAEEHMEEMIAGRDNCDSKR